MLVFVFPGLGGSQLVTNQTPSIFLSNLIWVNKVDIARGRIVNIDLNAEGTGPGPLCPSGVSCHTPGPLPELYGQLAAALKEAGHTVEPVGWDWRFGLADAGELARVAITTRAKDEPFVLLAHSAGGLVARLAAQGLKDHGKLSQIKRIIYLGTPHFGTYYPLATITRQSGSYQSLNTPYAYQIIGGGPVPDDMIQQLLARQVAFWELLPFRDYGPYHDNSPDTIGRLYQATSYRGYNKYVIQGRLESAQATQASLKTAVFPDVEVIVYGMQQDTPADYSWDKEKQLILKAVYQQDGDNTVETVSSKRPDVGTFVGSSEWAHDTMPQIGEVQKAIIRYIGA